MFVYTIQPVVNPVVQPVLSCKRGLKHNVFAVASPGSDATKTAQNYMKLSVARKMTRDSTANNLRFRHKVNKLHFSDYCDN